MLEAKEADLESTSLSLIVTIVLYNYGVCGSDGGKSSTSPISSETFVKLNENAMNNSKTKNDSSFNFLTKINPPFETIL